MTEPAMPVRTPRCAATTKSSGRRADARYRGACGASGRALAVAGDSSAWRRWTDSIAGVPARLYRPAPAADDCTRRRRRNVLVWVHGGVDARRLDCYEGVARALANRARCSSRGGLPARSGTSLSAGSTTSGPP